MAFFNTKSQAIRDIIDAFNLTKALVVSSIIVGPKHLGKKSLLRYLFPDATFVSCADEDKIRFVLEKHDEIVMYDFEKLTNYSLLDFSNKRIIATANCSESTMQIEDIFAFIYKMPPLEERKDDIEYMSKLFLKDACSLFSEFPEPPIVLEEIEINTTNYMELKKSIYRAVAYRSMGEYEICKSMYTYLYSNLEGSNAYSKYLSLYEKPLIEAGLRKYGSQLKLSEILGINRNTLRKKINEHKLG